MATPVSSGWSVEPQAYVPEKLPKVPEELTILSKCLVGIEVEVENAIGQVKSINPVWTTENDGSLRNQGIEFISRVIPAFEAPGAMSSLMTETLNENCCFSPRTSIHVHLDMSSQELGKSIDLALLYGCFEPLFYRFVGRGRMNNIYCVPIFRTRVMEQLAKSRAEVKIRGWSKYTGLNLNPLVRQGTVEFRHMHGTFDVRKVCLWIRLITSLRDYVINTESRSLRSMILEFDSDYDYRSLFLKIFGQDAELLKYHNFMDIAEAVDASKQAFMSGAANSSTKYQPSSEAPYFTFRK